MGYEHIEIEQADRVATLFLNRPEKLNAMSEDMWADIPAAIADLGADEGVRAVDNAARGQWFEHRHLHFIRDPYQKCLYSS